MSSQPESVSRLDAISTRWSVLQQAHAGSLRSAAEARQTLVMRYSPAVKRYVAALVQNKQDAEDLAQDVVVRLLAGDFALADPNRGRFRDLLKTAVRNMVRHYWQRQKRRRTVAWEPDSLEQEAEEDLQDPWLSSWRNTVLDLAWRALQQEQRRRTGNVDYTLLRLRADHPDDSSEQLAARFAR